MKQGIGSADGTVAHSWSRGLTGCSTDVEKIEESLFHKAPTAREGVCAGHLLLMKTKCARHLL